MNSVTGFIVSGILAIAEPQKNSMLESSSQVKSYLSQRSEPIPPRRSQLETIPPRTPQPLPRKLPKTKPNPLQPNPSPVPTSSPLPIYGRIVVDRFEFLDHTAFSTEELTTKIKHLLGKPLSFAELLQVETILTQLYVQAGYVNSGAYIASGQNFTADSAVVQIQIVEGGLEAIEITGTSQLRANYIRDRLPAAKVTPLNQKKLLEDLQLLQLNPLIKSISAQLAAGSRPEASSLTIDIAEADTFTHISHPKCDR